jgi:hypothetical protein
VINVWGPVNVWVTVTDKTDSWQLKAHASLALEGIKNSYQSIALSHTAVLLCAGSKTALGTFNVDANVLFDATAIKHSGDDVNQTLTAVVDLNGVKAAAGAIYWFTAANIAWMGSNTPLHSMSIRIEGLLQSLTFTGTGLYMTFQADDTLIFVPVIDKKTGAKINASDFTLGKYEILSMGGAVLFSADYPGNIMVQDEEFRILYPSDLNNQVGGLFHEMRVQDVSGKKSTIVQTIINNQKTSVRI